MTKRLLNAFIICVLLSFYGTAQVQLISDFTFNDNLTDTEGNGTMSLMNGANYSFNNGMLTNGIDSAGGAPGLKVTLPDLLFDERNYTIQIDFSFSETFNYRKVVDFNLLTSDAGLYINDQLRLYSSGNYGSTTIAADSMISVMIARSDALDSAGVFLANGAVVQLESAANDLSGEFVAAPEGADRVLYFFYDDTVTVSEFSSSFTVDRIRIWNGDYTAVLGVNENQVAEFTCFPNPATTSTTVRFTEPVNGTLEILSADGREMERVVVSYQAEVEIPLEGLSAGMYLLRYNNEILRLLKK